MYYGQVFLHCTKIDYCFMVKCKVVCIIISFVSEYIYILWTRFASYDDPLEYSEGWQLRIIHCLHRNTVLRSINNYTKFLNRYVLEECCNLVFKVSKENEICHLTIIVSQNLKNYHPQLPTLSMKYSFHHGTSKTKWRGSFVGQTAKSQPKFTRN